MDSKLIQRNLIGLLVLAVIVLVVVFAVHSCIRSTLKSGFISRQEEMFGKQHLATAVALIELHKVRYGQYPQTLKDLKFTREWDTIALNSVTYYPNADRSAYFIEFKGYWPDDQAQPEALSGFRPEIEMPAEFWQGTGYDPAIKLQGSLKDF